jgi:hypothetical protein
VKYSERPFVGGHKYVLGITVSPPKKAVTVIFPPQPHQTVDEGFRNDLLEMGSKAVTVIDLADPYQRMTSFLPTHPH